MTQTVFLIAVTIAMLMVLINSIVDDYEGKHRKGVSNNAK